MRGQPRKGGHECRHGHCAGQRRGVRLYVLERYICLFAKRCAQYYSGFGRGYIRHSPLDDKHSFIGPAAAAAKKFFFEK